MNVWAAYQWYVSQYQPGLHITAPDNQSSWTSINSARAFQILHGAITDFKAALAANDAAATAIIHANHISNYSEINYHSQAAYGAAWAAMREWEGLPPALGLRSAARSLLRVLQEDFKRKGSKVVCMQDDLPDEYSAARQLIDPVVRGFLARKYSEPSQYELPEGVTNGCR